jgi:hypothetical protein
LHGLACLNPEGKGSTGGAPKRRVSGESRTDLRDQAAGGPRLYQDQADVEETTAALVTAGAGSV